jgi:hypothetical protein
VDGGQAHVVGAGKTLVAGQRGFVDGDIEAQAAQAARRQRQRGVRGPPRRWG